MTSPWFRHLCSRLRNNNPNVSCVLDLSIPNDKSATLLGSSLSVNIHLLELSVQFCGSTTDHGVTRFADGLSKSHVLEFRFVHGPGKGQLADALFRSLSHHPTSELRELTWSVADGDYYMPSINTSADTLVSAISNLRLIHLTGYLPASSLSAFGLALSHNTTVVCVKLQDMVLSTMRMEYLWPNALCLNHVITELHFANCEINDNSLQVFVSSWSPESSIEFLDLCYNLIRPSGAVNLLNHIKGNHPLLDGLDLRGNRNLDYEGLIQISATLTDHSINHISLSSCLRDHVPEMHVVHGYAHPHDEDYIAPEDRDDDEPVWVPPDPAGVILHHNNVDHVIVPTRTIRRSVRRYDASSGSWITEHRVYHLTAELAEAARMDQEVMTQRIERQRLSAAAALENVVSFNSNLRTFEITGNNFPPETERRVEYYSCRNKYLRQCDYYTLPAQVWCEVLGQLSTSNFAGSLIFCFLTENPSFIPSGSFPNSFHA